MGGEEMLLMRTTGEEMLPYTNVRLSLTHETSCKIIFFL